MGDSLRTVGGGMELRASMSRTRGDAVKHTQSDVQEGAGTCV